VAYDILSINEEKSGLEAEGKKIQCKKSGYRAPAGPAPAV